MPKQRKISKRNMRKRMTNQLGNLLPSTVVFSTSRKKSSTDLPMLTGGNSRCVFVTALMRRSYMKFCYLKHGSGNMRNRLRFLTSLAMGHLHHLRCRIRAARYPMIPNSLYSDNKGGKEINHLQTYLMICYALVHFLHRRLRAIRIH
jgi:hypothetical protein